MNDAIIYELNKLKPFIVYNEINAKLDNEINVVLKFPVLDSMDSLSSDVGNEIRGIKS